MSQVCDHPARSEGAGCKVQLIKTHEITGALSILYFEKQKEVPSEVSK